MSTHHIPEARIASEISTGINSLIAAANKHDRFNLVEDDNVPAANLDNTIHPIFKWFDCNGSMRQMLTLASQFLAHDSSLTFFVPLIYGRQLTTIDSGVRRNYLSDPLANASDVRRQELINGTREALHCLAHSIQFDWMTTEKRVYARTMTNSFRAVHKPLCCPAFQRKLTAKIEINRRFESFYTDKGGYAASSRCAQFRHDFLFASTIVHELVHAVGVMRRGNTNEEWIRLDHPSTEWGYAWEHFMFGFIINPQNRDQTGTNLLMKKVWADSKAAEEAGGKEYSDVSMSYIAQWFQKKTWDIVAKQGPCAISPPLTHFKIQSSHKYGAWIVSTDRLDIKQDIIALHLKWKQQRQCLTASGISSSTSTKIYWRSQTHEALKKHNVTTPLRTPQISNTDQARNQKPRVTKATCRVISKTADTSTVVKLRVQLNVSRVSRKRRSDEDIEVVRVAKVAKT